MMPIPDEQFAQLSALVDGESSDDERCDALDEIIESSTARDELRQLIDLRRATGRWRQSRHTGPRRNPEIRPAGNVSRPLPAAGLQTRRIAGAGYLAATIVGGLLVCIGLLIGRGGFDEAARAPAGRRPDSESPDNRRQLVVEPQQQRQAAEVFAFHESVTGPLSWFVSDEDEVRLGTPVNAGAARRPAALQLRIRDGASNRDVGTWLVICRDQTQAVMELPVHDQEFGSVRLSLLVEVQDEEIAADYSLMFGMLKNGAHSTHISGRRKLGVERTSVGHVFLNNRLLKIDAAAWALTDEEPQL